MFMISMFRATIYSGVSESKKAWIYSGGNELYGKGR